MQPMLYVWIDGDWRRMKTEQYEAEMLTRDKRQQAANALAKANPHYTTQEVMNAVAKMPTAFDYAYEGAAKLRMIERHRLAVAWWLHKHNLGEEPAAPLDSIPFEHPSGAQVRPPVAPGEKAAAGAKRVIVQTGSKKGRVAVMLQQEGGTTVDAIVSELGVSTAAASALIGDCKRMGLTIVKEGVTYTAK